ncbi:unnamed protein product, partial [Musa banksii]
ADESTRRSGEVKHAGRWERERERRGHDDVKLTATGFKIGRKKELQEGE